jgi:hemerythrin
MQAANFAGFAAHKAEHEALIGICAGLQKKFHAGERPVV